MRQLQLPVELLQLVFSYVSQHRYLPCSSGLDQRQDQGHEQWRGQDLSNPFAVVAEEEPYLNLSLLTGSQSMVTDTFLVRLTSLLLWNPAVLCQSTSVLVPRHAICHSRLRTLRMMDCFMVTAVVLDLTDRSTRLCEFDFCKPPIRKRHNLVTNPDAKVGPIFKNARTIVNMTTKANQQGCAMGSPDWIVLPSTYLYRLQLKNCRITDESIMAIFPKGVSALADAPTGSLGMFFFNRL
ncbi:hypothetical protein BASA84_001712 [Batrachochytrium salamandrivorans]|nr:hypothetical protein BASA84_001712 [Batrachochytrium salamandrivorans]